MLKIKGSRNTAQHPYYITPRTETTAATMARITLHLLLLFKVALLLWASASKVDAFGVDPGSPRRRSIPSTSTTTTTTEETTTVAPMSRRTWMSFAAATAAAATLAALPQTAASAADFTPGGSLVTERTIGVTVGNADASVSRKYDNSNVLFEKDYYFKFGTAAPWIDPDATDFPKTMPFTKSQQRYDALKKYGERVKSGFAAMKRLENSQLLPADQIPDPADKSDVYELRPMGLLANGFLASENTGTPNELFLARWYINEIYLIIGDMRFSAAAADDPVKRKTLYQSLKKAVNSYLTLLNRNMTAKVGDKFEYF